MCKDYTNSTGISWTMIGCGKDGAQNLQTIRETYAATATTPQAIQPVLTAAAETAETFADTLIWSDVQLDILNLIQVCELIAILAKSETDRLEVAASAARRSASDGVSST